ncbi:O-antigen biosynthesis glycosyltransferase WbnK isoform X1 [Folsomia candida]|nr:O-antigen biosynthesis glycosyltransferase WbnK isoform X1 [Folsomia candida]XP_035712000.1 O-antigen biosynthesis glycosyltransferase WbnK isoform X1 [Folsomia candida]XP_035712001.1 O-antigen biosynthesis glycosyltransferase WbnK isoform X1 [Folsomia candida]
MLKDYSSQTTTWLDWMVAMVYKNFTIKRVFFGLVLFVIVIPCFDYYKRWDWTELHPPGIIMEKVGGLGNQLFIYACAYSLSKKLGVPLYLEIPSARILNSQANPFYDSNARPYVLHKFRVFYDKAIEGWYTRGYPWSEDDVLRVNDRDLLYRPIPTNKLIIIQDYCQSEVFFEEYIPKIKEMFQLDLTPEELSRPPIQKWINIISDAGENSVAIHIRRGDYGEDERKDNNWFTPICFYQKSVKTMLAKLDLSKDASFFIFSDQIDLVRQELLSGLQLPANVHIHFVSCSSCTTSLEDFYLMMICKHAIIANSTFSWWAAYLNKNEKKTIIAPTFHPQTLTIYEDPEYRRFKEYEMKLFYPDEWIVVDPFKDEIIK